MDLTFEQKKPVESDNRINVVLSVPGSGKTTVLVARAMRLWNLTREPTLIVTFSKKAAQEIMKRIGPEYLQHIDVKTIHGFCFGILKSNWKELGEVVGKPELWPTEPKIVTKAEELELLQELFPNENHVQLYEKIDGKFRAWPISPSTASRMYIQGVYFGKFTKREFEQWAVYEKERIARGMLNFNDMVDLANVLTPLPYVSAELSKKYSHILIDEAQDTSEQQWAILRPLVMAATTTLVVGDYNQSIYGWRNADGSVLLNVGDMPDAVTFRLSQTFRSGTFIAKIANLICPDKSSQIKAQDHDGRTEFRKFTTTEAEVEWILRSAGNGAAIISRTNSYLEQFERRAIELGIPYQGAGFYRALHIRDVAKYLRGFKDDKETALSIIDKAYTNNNTYTRVEKDDFKLISSIIETKGVEHFLDLVNKAELTETGEGFVLTTGHASKGLEWDKVFVVGCHAGHVPHRLSRDDKEERNLLYVMTTRARNDLIITYQNEPSHYLPKESINGAGHSH